MPDRAAISAHLAAARPRAVASLLGWCRDLDLAEDGFQAAALRAAKLWPDKGLPRDPTAWLIHVSRNAVRDALRQRARRAESQIDPGLEIADDTFQPAEEQLDRQRFQDEVLQLLLLCCHPTLKPGDQILLCLRYVLGLSVNDVARAHVTSADTIQRRISRARARAQDCLRDRSEQIAPEERAEGLSQIRRALYLMYNKGYSASHDEPHVQPVLVREAIRLARLLVTLFPGEPESLGLLSLMLGQSARLAARVDAAGALVTLDLQDRSLWDRDMISQANLYLANALRTSRPGPYQLQAAIAAVHNASDGAQSTDWEEIHRLYLILEALEPSPVVRLNRIVAASKVHGTESALEDLQSLAEPLASYLPYHAVFAGLSEKVGRHGDAMRALTAALNCNPSTEEEAHLRRELKRLAE